MPSPALPRLSVLSASLVDLVCALVDIDGQEMLTRGLKLGSFFFSSDSGGEGVSQWLAGTLIEAIGMLDKAEETVDAGESG
jgi:hypothetical protein